MIKDIATLLLTSIRNTTSTRSLDWHIYFDIIWPILKANVKVTSWKYLINDARQIGKHYYFHQIGIAICAFERHTFDLSPF